MKRKNDSRSRNLSRAGCLALMLIFVLPATAILGNPAFAAGYEKTAWLGVSIQEVSPELADVLALDLRTGVLITEVAPDSPAEWAGLRKEDVILEIDGRPIRDPAALMATIRGYRPGEELRILVWRYADEHLFRVKLGSRPAGDMVAPGAPFEIPEAPAIPPLPQPGPSPTPRAADPLELVKALRRPVLGVEVVPVNEGLARHFDARPNEGLLIVEVIPESAADKAGLESGDILLRVDGKTLSSADELRRELRAADELELHVTILRDGTEQTVRVELPQAKRESPLRRETERLGRDYRERLRPALRDHLQTFRGRLEDADDTARRELDQLREELGRLREELQELREELREQLR